MSADTERDDFIPSTSRNQDIHRNSILRDCNLHTFELSQACFPFTENKYQHPVLGVLVLSKNAVIATRGQCVVMSSHCVARTFFLSGEATTRCSHRLFRNGESDTTESVSVDFTTIFCRYTHVYTKGDSVKGYIFFFEAYSIFVLFRNL